MEEAPLVKLTRRGTVVATRNPDAWAAHRQTFEQQHCVLLPQLLDPAVIAYALSTVADKRGLHTHEDTSTKDGKAGTYARERRFGRDHPLNAMFYVLLNQRPFLQAVDEICGCGDKLRCAGRYFEMHPPDGFQDWHQDDCGARLLGIAINLSPQPFAGGQFQLRHMETKQIFATIGGQLGDCHLFRIHPRLSHRTTRLEGTAPRCVYAGWITGEQAWEDDLPAGLAPRSRNDDTRVKLTSSGS